MHRFLLQILLETVNMLQITVFVVINIISIFFLGRTYYLSKILFIINLSDITSKFCPTAMIITVDLEAIFHM